MGCPWLWLRYACLHGSGAVLTCPRGRERYAGLSKNPFTFAISDRRVA